MLLVLAAEPYTFANCYKMNLHFTITFLFGSLGSASCPSHLNSIGQTILGYLDSSKEVHPESLAEIVVGILDNYALM